MDLKKTGRVSAGLVFIVSLICIGVFILVFYLPNGEGSGEVELRVDSKAEKLYKKWIEDKKKKRLELRKRYKEIIRLYKNEKYTHAEALVKDTFHLRYLRSFNKMTGYVVASYFGLGDYENAAIEVLKREKRTDRRTPAFLLSLKDDLALCMRNYAIKNSIAEGFALTSKLKNRFNSKILSHFWCVVPLDILWSNRWGHHCRGLIEKNLDRDIIMEVIQQHPDDLYLSYGHYLLGNYSKALTYNPDHRLKKILVYASGYSIIREIYLKTNRFKRYANFISYAKRTPENLKQLLKAKNHLETYVNDFPPDDHTDDAIYWLGWLEANFERYEQSLKWLRRLDSDDDTDYYSYINQLREKVFLHYLKEVSAEEAKKHIEGGNKLFLTHEQTELFRIICSRLPAKDLILWAQSAKFQENRMDILFLIAKAYLHNSRTEDANKTAQLITDIKFRKNYIDYYSYYINSSVFKQKKIMEIARMRGNIKAYEKASIQLRRNYGNHGSALELIDEAIKKFSNKFPVDYLLYLKILTLKGYMPEMVETVLQHFYQTYPKSKYIDDAMAEWAKSQLIYFKNIEEGEKTVMKLLRLYPKRNACDNALTWLAYAYLEADQYNKALDLNKLIFKKYPYTRHAKAAEWRIKPIDQLLKQKSYFLIVGSFANSRNAKNLTSRLKDRGYKEAKVLQNGDMYRVSLLEFATYEEAVAAKKVQKKGWILKLKTH